jgi:hypothetical protein
MMERLLILDEPYTSVRFYSFKAAPRLISYRARAQAKWGI